MYKMICDVMNGKRFQWRYYDDSVGLWFDIGDAYDTFGEAALHKPDEKDY